MMDEKKWMEKIKDSARDVEVPESLKPENIEQKLREVKVEKKRSRAMVYSRRLGAAAAAVLVLGLAWQGQKLARVVDTSQPAPVKQEREEGLTEPRAAETEGTAESEENEKMTVTSEERGEGGQAETSEPESAKYPVTPEEEGDRGEAETVELEGVKTQTTSEEENARGEEETPEPESVKTQATSEEMNASGKEETPEPESVKTQATSEDGSASGEEETPEPEGVKSLALSGAGAASGQAESAEDERGKQDTGRIVTERPSVATEERTAAADEEATQLTATRALTSDALTPEEEEILAAMEANEETLESDWEPGTDSTSFSPAGSYEEVFEKIAEWQSNNVYACAEEGTRDYGVEMSSVTTGVGGQADVEKSSVMTADYSVTNQMELGVDEGDIVKTDGKFLYLLHGGSVQIFRIFGENPEKVYELSFLEGEDYLKEMYVEEDKLVLIASGTNTRMLKDESGTYEMTNRQYTLVETYSLTDPENPELLGSVRVDGSYHTSRKRGDYLYVLTDYIPVIETSVRDSIFIPLANGEEFAAGDMLIAPKMLSGNSLVAVSVDLANPGEIKDRKALVGISDLIYVSENSIYVTQVEWNFGYSSSQSTNIMKFSYKDGKLEGEGAGTVPGYLNNEFSMNEYEGYLRVVSTSWDGENRNGLYVLDEDMDVVARVENLAEGEQIYSARFLGDIGYFVTFKNTDPLFSVDLSDPENPVILGELKITGFSEYLHFWGEDKLLGIGKEADPESGEITGVKLSMFDISDPGNVTEEAKLVIGEGNLYCPGVDNYKAILADERKNLIGVAVGEDYLVYSYSEENGFRQKLTEELSGDTREARGVYVGEVFYLVDQDSIRVFDMEKEFKKTRELYL